jgi:hypothetical protein
MQVAPAWTERRRSSRSNAAVSGDTPVACRRSDAILEALRPCAAGPASEDGAEEAGAPIAMIVATKHPPHQVRGERSGGRRRDFFFSG